MKRILQSLVSFFSYLGGMIAFTMLSVILSAFMTLAVCRLFGAQIGFSLPVYAGLLFVLALFATAFALFFEYAVCTEGYSQYAGKCTCCFGIHYLGWLL